MSRYPTMNQAPLPYDRSLLAAAPALTRQDRQAGYDVNALEQGTYPQPSTMGRQPAQAQAQAPVAPPADPFRDSYDERDYSPTPGSEKQRPWWKRKRWAALALIIFIGIICGIIAGVVTAKNARNTSALAADPQNQNTGISPPSSATSTSSSPLPTTATPTRTTPALTTGVPRNGNGGTTIVFGGQTTTLPPGVVLPTATGRPAPDPLDSGDDEEIPLICYVTPRSRECAPYFEDDPL